MKVDLTGRVAVVTGGGRGIGAATARALADAGASVVVAARTPHEIERVAAELELHGRPGLAVVCDVTDAAAVTALRDRAEERFGGVDILVSNAGVATSAPLAKVSLAEWERLFAVNTTGAFLCAQAFAPKMAERGWGRIVHVASVAGRTAAPYISAYASTKHALVGLTRALAAELAARGVTVNAVCPGFVDTAMTDESVERIVSRTGLAADDARGRIVAMNPQGRLIEPVEVAFLIACLCDERARGVNGQTLGVDGGGFLGMSFLESVDPEALGGRGSGYSNGIVAPAGARMLFVAGQIGWNRERKLVDGGFVAQFEQALTNVVEVVRAAGGQPENLARLTVFVVEKGEYLTQLSAVGAAFRRVIGRHFPAMSLVEVRGLLEPGARVEIEATAALPAAASNDLGA